MRSGISVRFGGTFWRLGLERVHAPSVCTTQRPIQFKASHRRHYSNDKLGKKIHPDVVAVSKSKATARALWMGQNLTLLQWKSDKPPSFNTGIKESLCVLRPEKQRRRRAECHEKFSGTWSLSVEYVQKVSPS